MNLLFTIIVQLVGVQGLLVIIIWQLSKIRSAKATPEGNGDG